MNILDAFGATEYPHNEPGVRAFTFSKIQGMASTVLYVPDDVTDFQVDMNSTIDSEFTRFKEAIVIAFDRKYGGHPMTHKERGMLGGRPKFEREILPPVMRIIPQTGEAGWYRRDGMPIATELNNISAFPGKCAFEYSGYSVEYRESRGR